jgi:hypothetical protein
MAVDKVLEKKSVDQNIEWTYSRTLSVSDFLNSLIRFTPHSEFPSRTFSDHVSESSLLQPKELATFLSGRIFFTHFIRVDCTLSIEMLVQAWNRGAAMMCKAYNPRFDHVIPVMLDVPNSENAPSPGRLYGKWTDKELAWAREHVSGIFIDSKCYTKWKNWTNHSVKVTPLDAGAIEDPRNLEDLKHFSRSNDTNDPDDSDDNDETIRNKKSSKPNLLHNYPIQNVYLAMVQDFGDVGKHETVKFGPCGTYNGSLRETPQRLQYTSNSRQLKIILNGIDENTYECLRNRVGMDKDIDRSEARMYLKEIRNPKNPYLDEVKNDIEESIRKMKSFHIAETLPLLLGNNADVWDEFWEARYAHQENSMEGVEFTG